MQHLTGPERPRSRCCRPERLGMEAHQEHNPPLWSSTNTTSLLENHRQRPLTFLIRSRWRQWSDGSEAGEALLADERLVSAMVRCSVGGPMRLFRIRKEGASLSGTLMSELSPEEMVTVLRATVGVLDPVESQGSER